MSALDRWRDVVEGIGGAGVMTALALTPFLRRSRSHWGLDERTAARSYPGDHLVPSPRWMWTHAVEIEAPAANVWPWIAQLGADRGGFYSYQWLENVAGCKLRNAEVVRPEWAHVEGDGLLLHPKMPPLKIELLVPGSCFVAHGRPDEEAVRTGRPWAGASWLFFIEPLGDERCRLISRYRCVYSDDLANRFLYGQAVLEPIGFAMDRRMLLGVKARVERRQRRPTRPPANACARDEHANR